MLEMICYNFTSRMPFPYVIKIGRAFKATKMLTKLAWRLSIDRYSMLFMLSSAQTDILLVIFSFRTLINLQFPPHVVALGCIYLAALLSSFEQGASPERPGYNSSQQIAVTLGKPGFWEDQYQTQVQDLQGEQQQITSTFLST